jgi:transaldolase
MARAEAMRGPPAGFLAEAAGRRAVRPAEVAGVRAACLVGVRARRRLVMRGAVWHAGPGLRQAAAVRYGVGLHPLPHPPGEPAHMKFFIDSADLGEIKKALDLGLCDGVTTNPSLVAKTGRKFDDVLREIVALKPGPISAEVTSVEAAGMLREAEHYAKFGEDVVVKIPLIVEGLKAVKQLTARGIKTNVTLCFSAVQALLAAKAGATYVSPFVGRLDDVAEDGMQLIEQIIEIYSNYQFKTQVLVASVRHPIHVLQAARLGADVATIPYKVIEQLAQHPLTDKGLKQFLADWEKVPKT